MDLDLPKDAIAAILCSAAQGVLHKLSSSLSASGTDEEAIRTLMPKLLWMKDAIQRKVHPA